MERNLAFNLNLTFLSLRRYSEAQGRQGPGNVALVNAHVSDETQVQSDEVQCRTTHQLFLPPRVCVESARGFNSLEKYNLLESTLLSKPLVSKTHNIVSCPPPPCTQAAKERLVDGHLVWHDPEATAHSGKGFRQQHLIAEVGGGGGAS